MHNITLKIMKENKFNEMLYKIKEIALKKPS